MSPSQYDSPLAFIQWNRALSIRQNRNPGGRSNTGGTRRGFSLSSLRGSVQPELSKRLYRLIKSENNLVSAHQAAARERISIATQLSEWGEQTNDEAVSDISDKVGVVLSEIGEQEDTYAHALDDSRSTLKAIRNIEKSVQPSRDNKAKITDEIAKLKSREPENTKLVVLEQELVRAEAENLVAEAQLSNVTRQKLKETYDAEFTAIIERAEKQIILARHGQRLLKLLDDSPVVPGDTRLAYEGGAQARQVLNDAEDDLRDWRPEPADDVQGASAFSHRPLSPTGGSSKDDFRNNRRDSGFAVRNSQINYPGYEADSQGPTVNTRTYDTSSQAYDHVTDGDGEQACTLASQGGAEAMSGGAGAAEGSFDDSTEAAAATTGGARGEPYPGGHGSGTVVAEPSFQGDTATTEY